MKAFLTLIILSAIAFNAVAQDYPPPRLKNEGSAAGAYYSLDCVGPAVNCTNSSGQATVTLDVEAGDISNLSASDTQVLFRDSAGISGDADMTWNKTTNLLDMGSNFLETGYIGLAGAAASDAAAINIGVTTSSTMISPILADITYTGTSTVTAGLQSEMQHTGSASSPTVWGILARATGASANSGFNTYVGVASSVDFNSTSDVCGAFEVCLFEGINASVMGVGGGTHDATSLIAALGIYVPGFITPAGGGTVIRHGILMSEPLSLAVGTKIGLDADILANADTVIYKDNGSGEMRFEVDGTEALALKSTQIGFFSVAPASRPSAYTQTYSTTSRTVPTTTFSGATLSTYTATAGGSGFRSDSDMEDFLKDVDKIKDDLDNTKKVLNQILDDFQLYGLLQ